VVKIPGIELTLGGQAWIVPPAPLGALEQFDELLERMEDFNPMNPVWRRMIVDITFAALKRNYPEIAREDVAGMLDVANMLEVFESVMDVAGLKRKATEEGEAGGASA
jgi:hypothetical protein